MVIRCRHFAENPEQHGTGANRSLLVENRQNVPLFSFLQIMKAIIQTQTDAHYAASEAGFASSQVGQALRRSLTGSSLSNQRIADFLLRNPVRATAWGIEELATHAQTSTATLSRFASSLGFSGFAALRAAMAEALQDALQPVFQPVEKLRGAMQRGRVASNGHNPVIAESLDASLSNLRTTAAGLTLARLAAIAQKLGTARCVYTVGFGLSAHLAAMLALDLQPFCPQLINVVEFGGTEVAAGRLMNIGKNDVLLVISLPRYANDALVLARYARDRKAHVIAITDSMAAPLANVAHDTLLALAAHPVLSSSSTAALLVIEALVSTLMVSRSGHVEQAAKLTDAISGYLYQGIEGASTAAKRSRR